MAGFTQPVYEVIAFSLQSFSVYDDNYELFETKYNSPITVSALSEYKYQILDTVSIQNRKTYLVYFHPKRKKRAAGLEGLLYIDTENYAVAKAIMRIRGVLDISAVHEFNYIDNEKLWFPADKEFKIVKGKSKDDIKILGETFKFDGDEESAKRKKQSSDFSYLLSKSYNFDVKYNTPITIKHDAVAIEVTSEAINRDENFWRKFRTDSTDIRSNPTYIALDSIIKKRKYEKKLRIGRKIINGYLPLAASRFGLAIFVEL
ncbi:DUF5686 family protein [Flavobacterium sp. 3HN19-14]|uniref:DUF5686 family protein n=1 Tax=Flavobacterium sp. 3HN19-14 TaxID=3448133 RepID=UPI003EE29E6D